MKEYSTIEVKKHNGIADLAFNRPAVLNAMNRNMMDEIIDALQMIVSDPFIRVAVITGRGKAFMAGADIKEYSTQTIGQFRKFQQNGLRLNSIIEKAPIPFIAAVNGFALGGGFEIALCCDLIVANSSAKFGLPEVHLGLIPGGGGTQRLIQRIGLNRVKELLLLGDIYTASQMFNWGIVNIVTDGKTFAQTVDELTEKIKSRPAQSLSELKKLLQPTFIDHSFMDRIEREGEVVSGLFSTPIAEKLIGTFTKKNK